MLIIRNRILPFAGFNAINLIGVLFVRKGLEITPEIINHERIHTAQILELAVIGFYLLYIMEWLVRLFCKGNAYRALSFEKEAYFYQNDLDYLSKRKKYAWIKFL